MSNEKGRAVNRSGKLTWGCVALVVVAVVLALIFSTPVVLLFVLPCAIMIGAMVWFMWGGTRGGSHRGRTP
jgi:hypothetical protein